MQVDLDCGSGALGRVTDRNASSAPLLERLREQTRLIHQQLEAELPFLDSDLTRERYTRLLERFYGFYKPFEESVFNLLSGHSSSCWERRRKSNLLAVDLGALHVAPEGLPQAVYLPAYRSVEQALGGLYVTEGATLGGQLISRRLFQQLGLTDRNGAAFFACYGDATGRMWKEFRDALCACSSPRADQVIVQSAIETFSCFANWILPSNKDLT